MKKLVELGEISSDGFELLMAQYCPDIQLHRGWLGGRSWGKSYWSGYSDEWAMDTLCWRLANRILELELGTHGGE